MSDPHFDLGIVFLHIVLRFQTQWSPLAHLDPWRLPELATKPAMKNLLLLIGLLVPISILHGQEPGSALCFGDQCPCGNDDPDAGCMNSTGKGALLGGSGTASISADDLVLVGSQLPFKSVCIVLVGDEVRNPALVQDGKLCVGGKIGRMQQHKNTGPDGTLAFNRISSRLLAQSRLHAPGDTFYFQLWYRDTPVAVCGSSHKANTSNSYAITWLP